MRSFFTLALLVLKQLSLAAGEQELGFAVDLPKKLCCEKGKECELILPTIMNSQGFELKIEISTIPDECVNRSTTQKTEDGLSFT